ncbi:MAG: hypothetical protein M5U01_19725 [Ardenticatenaceae bacterium]|nr:hypothetical protein [Ardenticatenaceae bacterium]
MVDLLTNATYIGHWLANDVVARWHNHPAIVPEALAAYVPIRQ